MAAAGGVHALPQSPTRSRRAVQQSEILVVDDTAASARLLAALLEERGHRVQVADSGEAALARLTDSRAAPPDLVLTDLMMPGIDGIELVRRIRAEPRFAVLPVVVVTAAHEKAERLRALQAGADDFINKPVDRAELMARVHTLLRVKRLYDTVQSQAAELKRWSAELEQRVAAEVDRNQRLTRLQRFFSPALAQRLLTDEAESVLASHRREIVVVFLDLRGWTAFSETAEPEEVMQALAEYHSLMGERVQAAEGTIERFNGDGLMVFFNDPLPQPDAAVRALDMALAMQRDAARLQRSWRTRGFDLALGIGVAQGFATLGRIGFEGRIDYGAIGPVTNLAFRLCGVAAAGEVLATTRVLTAAEQGGCTALDGCARAMHGPMSLHGFSRPIEIVGLRAKVPAHEAQ